MNDDSRQVDLDAHADIRSHRNLGSVTKLDVGECLDLLETASIGRVAFNDEAGPIVLPVNYAVDQGSVVFRSTFGAKLAGAEQHSIASFQVDAMDQDSGTGWSVLVRGRLAEVVRGEDLDRLADSGLEALAGGDQTHWIRVQSASITGRRVGD